MVLMTVLTIVAILLLVAVLVVGLVKIDNTLERIGGRSLGYTSWPSLLSKARWGVRAIEKQTSALGPGVARLNGDLRALNGQLGEVEAGVAGLVSALERQGGNR